MWKIFTVVLWVALLLGGCGGAAPTASTAPSLSVASGGGITESEQPLESPTVPLNPAFYTIDRSSPPHWSGDGQRLEAFSGNKLMELDLNNNLLKETAFVVPEAYKGLVYSGDGAHFYSWNDRYLFTPMVGDRTYTRVMELEGKKTIVNALLFGRDGKILKVFPQVDGSTVEKDWRKYEKSVPGDFCRVVWVTEDVFAIDVQSRLYLYSVSRDELWQVEDCSKEMAAGYTIYCANSFGTRMAGVDGGYYYYTMAREIDEQKQGIDTLWRVRWGSPAEQLLDGQSYDRFQVDKELLSVYRYQADSCPLDGEDTPKERVWAARLDGEKPPVLLPEPVAIQTDYPGLPQNEEGYILWEVPHFEKTRCGQPTTFTYVNLSTGQRIRFSPNQIEGRTSLNQGFFYNPVGAVQQEGGVTFLYCTDDYGEPYDPAKEGHWQDSYNTVTKEHKTAKGVLYSEENVFFWNSDGIHFVEVQEFGRMQHTLRIAALQPVEEK